MELADSGHAREALIAAAVEEQRLRAGDSVERSHVPEDDQMVTALMYRINLALDPCACAREAGVAQDTR